MLTQEELDQVVAYLHSTTNEVTIDQLPLYSTYGELASNDCFVIKMIGVNKTVKTTIGALASMIASSAATALASPVLSLSVVADDEIDASWSAVTNATNYKLYRSETPSFNDADLIYTGSGLLFNDTGRTAATQYFYWLQATGSGYADSAYSNSTATTTGAGSDVTPPVYSTIEVSTTNPNQVKITYNETLQSVPSATTTQWSIPGKSCTFAAISGSVVTLTFNANFVPGETPLLTYTGNQVKDIAGNLAATFTNQAVTNTLAVTAQRLEVPVLTATAVSATQVNLTWTNVANEENFAIEISTNSGSTWSSLINPAADVLAYNATGLTPVTLYHFRIKAVGNGTSTLDSIWNTVTATTPSTTAATWGIILNFPVLTIRDSEGGVTGVCAGGGRQLHFNGITPLTGGPLTMRIIHGGTNQMNVDGSTDYLGKAFSYKHTDGNFYNGIFAQGDVTV